MPTGTPQAGKEARPWLNRIYSTPSSASLIIYSFLTCKLTTPINTLSVTCVPGAGAHRSAAEGERNPCVGTAGRQRGPWLAQLHVHATATQFFFEMKHCAHDCTLVEVQGPVADYSPVEPQSAWLQATGCQPVVNCPPWLADSVA